MKITSTIAALFLMLSPAAALAYECNYSKTEQQASMSCADGMTFDTTTNSCVAETTS